MKENRIAELFGKVGHALFGERWKADMAAVLKVSVDHIDDWSKGQGEPPRDVWLDLATQIRDRRNVLPDLLFAVLLVADSDERKPRCTGGPQTSDDPAFSTLVLSTRDVAVPLVIRSVGEAIALIDDLPEDKKTTDHWWLARQLLHDTLGHPKDQKVKLAEVAFRSALRKERWLG